MNKDWEFTIEGLVGRLQVDRTYSGGFCMQIEDDSTGDTDTGFGSYCEITLSKEEGLRLANWLIEQAKK